MKRSLYASFAALALTALIVPPASAVQVFNWQMNCSKRQLINNPADGGFVDLSCPVSGLFTGTISMPDSYAAGSTYTFSPATAVADRPVIRLIDAYYPTDLVFSPDSFGFVTLPATTGTASWLVTTAAAPKTEMVTAGATTTLNSDVLAATNRFVAQGTDLQVVAIPEPGTWALMAAGLLAIGWRGRRSMRQDS